MINLNRGQSTARRDAAYPLATRAVRGHSERSLPVLLFIRRACGDGCRQTQGRAPGSTASRAQEIRRTSPGCTTRPRPQHAAPQQSPKLHTTPWRIFLYTNNHLRPITHSFQNIPCILGLRPPRFMWSAGRAATIPPIRNPHLIILNPGQSSPSGPRWKRGPSGPRKRAVICHSERSLPVLLFHPSRLSRRMPADARKGSRVDG
jgi:hypothetical protein